MKLARLLANLSFAAAAGALNSPLIAQPATFQGLGPVPGTNSAPAIGLSADGSTVLLWPAQGDGFRWTASAGLVPLGDPLFRPAAISGDGSVVVGIAWVGLPIGFEAARWTAAMAVVLQGSSAGGGYVVHSEGPRAVSEDGQTMVGTVRKPEVFPRCPVPLCLGCPDLPAFRCLRQASPGGGLQKLSPLAGYDNSVGSGVSSDGAVVVGSSFNYCLGAYGASVYQPCVWAGGGPPSPVGPLFAEAGAVSGDGSTVIGRYGFSAGTFRWTAGTGAANLAMGAARALSFDGRIVVGSSGPSGEAALIWDEAGGARNLRAVLMSLGLNLDGWALTGAVGVSADGRTVAGNGTNPAGQPEAWIAFLGAAVGCYPDCNADGALTVSDFGCFQTKFVLADPYADCNADGLLTVADFGCFQTKFVPGCP
jgi:uncharacterized membrane protein